MSVDDQLERELQRRLANYNPDVSCPHCAAKDAEIAELREQLARADERRSGADSDRPAGRGERLSRALPGAARERGDASGWAGRSVMRLQINTAGAWRNVVDYTSRHDNEVRFQAVGLARVLDAKLRVLDDQGRTLTWWSKDRGWHNPLRDTA